jgi:endonuclease YncB( thermonuclease family)
MKRKHAFIFSLIITILIAVNYSLLSPNISQERETVEISRIIDGDTIELKDKRIIRLLNINAPEKNTPNHELSSNFLQNFQNQSVEIEIIGTDKYERTLAKIYTPNYLNLELVEKGLAAKFLVEQSELQKFAEAEEKAIQESKGIWQHSPHFSCIESKIDEIKEIITLQNDCNKINIRSWILKDESTRQYKFENQEIKTLRLHTHEGQDNQTDIFWNSKTNIWNNDRDTLYLFDKEGNIVHYNSYGY